MSEPKNVIMHFFKIILSGYEFQYLVPSFLFILAF